MTCPRNSVQLHDTTFMCVHNQHGFSINAAAVLSSAKNAFSAHRCSTHTDLVEATHRLCSFNIGAVLASLVRVSQFKTKEKCSQVVNKLKRRSRNESVRCLNRTCKAVIGWSSPTPEFNSCAQHANGREWSCRKRRIVIVFSTAVHAAR